MLKNIPLCLLVTGTALAADRPAVRLGPATPMEPTPVTARAASGSGFDPFAQAPRTDARNSVTDPEKPSEPGNWKKFTKWMDDRAKAVKKAVVPPPEQPQPRVGVKGLFEKQPALPPPTAKVNAANPAYRWYGWGTAVPGANQFAPTGEYPLGSAQWYNQTGATPGAFPMPTMNPYRPEPGQTPPVYVAPPQTPPPVVIQYPPPTYTPPPPKAIAETTAPKLAPVMASPFAPGNQVPLPPPPQVPVKEPAWKPAAATEQLIVPVIRGQEPSFADSPLARNVNAACKGLVSHVTIAETGPATLTITFEATTQTLVEIAVKAVSDIPELKAYEVRFQAGVIQ